MIKKICTENNCKIQARFNYDGNTFGIYCTQHKKDGMINVSYTKCSEKKCRKRGMFYLKEISKEVYCSTHKKDGMIKITTTDKEKLDNTCVEITKISENSILSKMPFMFHIFYTYRYYNWLNIILSNNHIK